jgi:hypothetical protein
VALSLWAKPIKRDAKNVLRKKQNGNESGVFVFFVFFLTSHAVANAGHQMFAFVDLPRSTT